MTRRSELVDLIQALSREESTRQPTAASWLAQQDAKDRGGNSEQTSHDQAAPEGKVNGNEWRTTKDPSDAPKS